MFSELVIVLSLVIDACQLEQLEEEDPTATLEIVSIVG
jgi:hypothetical protein